MNKITKIALSVAILSILGCNIPTATTTPEPKTEPQTESQATKPETKISLCDEKPTTTEIGRDILPIDPKYKDLGFLGQLFTAYPCGKDRVKQVFGVEGDSYTLGSTIFLKGQPSQALIDTYLSIGFSCFELSSGAACKSETGDKKIELSKTVKVDDLMKLEPFYEFFKSDDCVNCG